jgi:hypothetical protein
LRKQQKQEGLFDIPYPSFLKQVSEVFTSTQKVRNILIFKGTEKPRKI